MTGIHRRNMEDQLAKNRGEEPQRPAYENKGISWEKAMSLMGWNCIRRKIGLQGSPFTEDTLIEKIKKYKPSLSQPEIVAKGMISAHFEEREWAGGCLSLSGMVDFYKLTEYESPSEEKKQYQIRWWNRDV